MIGGSVGEGSTGGLVGVAFGGGLVGAWLVDDGFPEEVFVGKGRVGLDPGRLVNVGGMDVLVAVVVDVDVMVGDWVKVRVGEGGIVTVGV